MANLMNGRMIVVEALARSKDKQTNQKAGEWIGVSAHDPLDIGVLSQTIDDQLRLRSKVTAESQLDVVSTDALLTELSSRCDTLVVIRVSKHRPDKLAVFCNGNHMTLLGSLRRTEYDLLSGKLTDNPNDKAD